VFRATAMFFKFCWDNILYLVIIIKFERINFGGWNI